MKKMIALLLALLMLLGTIGCAANETKADGSNTQQADKTTESEKADDTQAADSDSVVLPMMLTSGKTSCSPLLTSTLKRPA